MILCGFDLQALFSICVHNPLSDFWSVDTIFCLQTWSSPKLWAADTIFHLQTRSSQWLLIGGHYFPSVDTVLSVTFDRQTLFSVCGHDPLCGFEQMTLFSVCGHNPLSDFWSVDTIFCLRTWSSPKFWVADIIFCLQTCPLSKFWATDIIFCLQTLPFLSGRHYFPSTDTILSVTFEPQTLFSICRHIPLSDFWSVDTILCLQTWSSPKFW
jgi:hypothetical protein